LQQGLFMKFGMFFIGSSATDDHARALNDLLDQVCYAEELGYDSVWFAEHHSAYGMLGSPAVIMAAAAQRTTRIRLGVAVSVLPFHNPVSVAEDYATVDVLSGGRLDFAVGRGNQSLEYHMMQADRDHSKEVFWEALEIIQALWSAKGPISFHGRHFDFDNIASYPRPIQDPVPLWVAAVTKGTYEEVARRGLRIMTAAGLAGGSFEDFVSSCDAVRQALKEAGHDPSWASFPTAVNTYIASTPEKAVEEFKHAYWMQHELGPVDPFSAATQTNKDFAEYEVQSKALKPIYESPDTYIAHALKGSGILCTDPAGARAYLRRLRDAAGVDHFICPTNIGGLEHERVTESMRLFATEVAPEFRDGPPVQAAAE
jgi:alkanesulfonate monooxygenase SsuD/methylene tetrahydromethanopterin reductase-like flavin-dependent oxidoreductase (luciferase family)